MISLYIRSGQNIDECEQFVWHLGTRRLLNIWDVISQQWMNRICSQMLNCTVDSLSNFAGLNSINLQSLNNQVKLLKPMTDQNACIRFAIGSVLKLFFESVRLEKSEQKKTKQHWLNKHVMKRSIKRNSEFTIIPITGNAVLKAVLSLSWHHYKWLCAVLSYFRSYVGVPGATPVSFSCLANKTPAGWSSSKEEITVTTLGAWTCL